MKKNILELNIYNPDLKEILNIKFPILLLISLTVYLSNKVIFGYINLPTQIGFILNLIFFTLPIIIYFLFSSIRDRQNLNSRAH